MSFILDALKKSESDRQRQSGPALFEVKVAPPRTHLPAWAIAIAVLLVVNLGIVMWMLLRHPAHPGSASTEGPAAAGPATVSAPASTPAPASPPAATPVPSAVATAPQGPVAAGATALALPAATSAEPAAPAGASAAAAVPAAPTGSAAVAAAGGTASAGEANPDDYAPAQDYAQVQEPGGSLGGHVRRGTAAGVPLYQDAATTSGAPLPPLRLDLHVFAVRPQDRFVMINMHKLREGDSLPEGVHVDSITPEGAVLSYNGSKFLLPRE
jgi:general secretion pathway protein B